MKIVDRHTIELLKHTATNFLIAVALCTAALALDALEHWCARHEVSPWLIFGVGLVSRMTFVVDAVLFVATMSMVGAHLIRESFNRLFR